MGVYCDDATCGVRIEGNVFYRVASFGTVYSNGGHDITVRNNIFIEGYGPAYQLSETRCDHLDNDCDGVVDEDCTPQPLPLPLPRSGCGAMPGSIFVALALLAALCTARRRRSP